MESLTAPTAEDIAAWLTLAASWLPFLIFLFSLARVLLVWVEGAIIIWLPQSPDHWFWWFWLRLMQTIEYISLSLPRNSKAIREFYHWDKQQQRLKEEGANNEN